VRHKQKTRDMASDMEQVERVNTEERLIGSLSRVQRSLLYYLAYKGGNVSEYELEKYAMRKKVSRYAVAKVTTQLEDLDMCMNVSHSAYLSDYRISSRFHIPALKRLYKEDGAEADELKEHISMRSTFAQQLSTAVKNVVEHRSPVINPTVMRHAEVDVVAVFTFGLRDPEMMPLAKTLDDNLFLNVLSMMLDISVLRNDAPDDCMIARLTEEMRKISPLGSLYANEVLSLYRYYAMGEYSPARRAFTYFDEVQRAIHCLHEGNLADARTLFESALQKKCGKKKTMRFFDDCITQYFYIVTCAHIEEASAQKHVKDFADNKEASYYASLLPALMLARSTTGTSENELDSRLEQMFQAGSQDIYAMLKVFARFFAMLWDKKSPSDDGMTIMPALAILRHELQMSLALEAGEKARLNELFGQPVLAANPPKPRWERLLDDLLSESMGGQTVAQSTSKKRLIYVYDGYTLYVRMQSMLKNGSWSVPKNVASSAYEMGDIDYMDDADRDVYNRIGHNLFHLDVDTAFPALVGCDRVFYGIYRDLEPISIVREAPVLTIERTTSSFSIHANVQNVQRGEKDYVVENDRLHYTVISLTAEEAQLVMQLCEVPSMPLEAEAKLKAVLPVVSQRIKVESPLISDDGQMAEVDGSSVVTLQITPSAAVGIYHVQLLVHPLEGGVCRAVPGKGSAMIVDTRDGQMFRVRRALGEEKLSLDALLTFVDELNDDGVTVRIVENGLDIGTGQLLAVLDYARQQADRYAVEWPEGRKVKVVQSKEVEWKVGLRKNAGWFDIEGDVKIDERKVVKIGALMQLFDSSQGGNYIRLGDGEYMQLTDSLRRQLSRLESIATRTGKNTMRVPVAGASLLADAMAGDITFDNQDKLREMCDKIRQSYALTPRTPQNLQATLRDYQREGFCWMARLDSWGAGACLADDMGLGKTVQTIAMLLYDAKKGASLVVAPTSVVSNWQNELRRFAPSLNVTLLNDTPAGERQKVVDEAGGRDVVLTTYGILSTEAEMLAKKKWNVACLDEAHTIKNRDTKMARAAHSLSATTRIALTGTPLQNHLGELWSLFNFINPGLLGNYESFRSKFVMPIENGNKERQQQLRRMVLPFMLRRTKNEVVEELPDKTETIRTVELSSEEMHTYELIRREAKKRLEEDHKVSTNVLSEITKLRQAACAATLVNDKLQFRSSKIEQLLQLVDNIGEGNRILLFSQFTSFLKMICAEFDKEGVDYLYLDGATPMRQREQLVRRFQDGESRIFVISLKAGGLGLNLTGANYVIHMDPWWNPAIEQQATDRSYRIGQNQKVTVYHIIAAHTIEEKMLRLHKTKRDLADSLLEGADVSHRISEEDLQELLK